MCHLQDLYAKYKDKGLVILGFNCADDKKIALDMMRENGATFPSVLDSSDAAVKSQFQDYRATGVPLNYIIDRNGKIVDAWYGGGTEHPKAMAAFKKLGGELGEAIRRDADAAAAKAAPEVIAAAQRLFQVLRDADYDHDGISTRDWKHQPAKEINYNPDRNDRGWVRWVCNKFKKNPISDVRLGNVFANPGGTPTIHFALHLKDGEILEGDLPFQFIDWGSAGKQWVGQGGLDWHLRKTR
jgi:hypothetical protein